MMIGIVLTEKGCKAEMTDEEKSRELIRSSFAAQMAMLGYEPNGNPKDMVEVIRCKDCKHGIVYNGTDGKVVACEFEELSKDLDWFCADGERKDDDA